MQTVSELHDKFSKAKGIVLTDYKGLTVREISELRRQMKDATLEYRVVKNTLAKIASDGTAAAAVREDLAGPVGIAFGYDDPVVLTKKVLGFARGNEKLRIRRGVIEGKLCGIEEIKAISELPPRETLLAVLAGTMKSPLQKLASALSLTVAGFAHAVDALKRKRGA